MEDYVLAVHDMQVLEYSGVPGHTVELEYNGLREHEVVGKVPEAYVQ